MKTSHKIGGAFLLTGLGCCLAAPELLKDGTVLTDWSSPTTWVAGVSFVGAFLGAVTGAMALFKKDKEPLDAGQTERALGNALFKEGVATKADLNALAERLLADRDPGAEAPPVEQLAAALDGLAKSGAAAKTEAFALIGEDRVDEGLAQLEAFAQRQSEVLGQAAEQTADTWRQIGVLLLTRNVAKAAEAFEQAEAAAPGDRWTLVMLCRLYIGSLGKPGAAAPLLSRLHSSVTDREWKAITLEIEGRMLQVQGRLTDALACYEEHLALSRALVADLPDNATHRRGLSVALNKIGDALLDQERPEEALNHYEESLSLRRSLAADEPEDVDRQRDLAISLGKVGDVLRHQGLLLEALERYDESLALRRTLSQDDPSHAERQRDLSIALEKHGDTFRDLKRLNEALDHYDESLILCRALAKDDPSHAERRRDLSVALGRTGNVLRDQGRLTEALDRYEEALTLCRILAKDDSSHAERLRDLELALERTGDVLDAMGRTSEAIERYQESLPITKGLAVAYPDNVRFQDDLRITRKRIARLKAKSN